jgi:hypothetical protein
MCSFLSWTRIAKNIWNKPTARGLINFAYKYGRLQSKLSKLGFNLEIDVVDLNFQDTEINSPLVQAELERISETYPALYQQIMDVDPENLDEILSITEYVSNFTAEELEELMTTAPNLLRSITLVNAMPILQPALEFVELPEVPERYLVSSDLWFQDAWDYLTTGGGATVSEFLDDILFWLPGWGTFTWVTGQFLSYADTATDVIYRFADTGYDILINFVQMLRQAREYAEVEMSEYYDTLKSYIDTYAPLISQFIDINIFMDILDTVDADIDGNVDEVNLVIDQAIYDAQVRYVDEVIKPAMSNSVTTDILGNTVVGVGTGLVVGFFVAGVSLFLAPFTFGASLAIGVGVGAAIGLASGLVSAGVKLNEFNQLVDELGDRPT